MATRLHTVAAGSQAHPRRGLVLLGRLGLAARGILYLLIGALAVDLARGHTGASASQQGAVHTVAAQPFGHWLLIAFAAGVFGYAAWRAVQAASGHELESGRRRGAGDRLSAAASAVAYLGILGITLGVLLGSGAGGGGLERFTRWAMGISPWLVGGVGIGLLAVALVQAVKGLRRSFMKELDRGRMSGRARCWVGRLGLIGYCARAAVFALVGYGMLQAAHNYRPAQAKGLDGSLQGVLSDRFGPALVAVVAAGLIAFGLESLIESRYRRL